MKKTLAMLLALLLVFNCFSPIAETDDSLPADGYVSAGTQAEEPAEPTALTDAADTAAQDEHFGRAAIRLSDKKLLRSLTLRNIC